MDPATHAKALAMLRAFLERRWMTMPTNPWAFQIHYQAGVREGFRALESLCRGAPADYSDLSE
jgi:hypothetical protein